MPIGSQGWLYATTVGRVKLQSMVFKDYLAGTERDVRNCCPYKKQSIQGKERAKEKWYQKLIKCMWRKEIPLCGFWGQA